MLRRPLCIRVILLAGAALFFLCFLASTIVPEIALPAVGLSDYNDFTIRLYGIFQLSWALLLLAAARDAERNRAIIDIASVTGALVAIYYVIYQVAVIRSGWHLLLNAAILSFYSGLLLLCRPKAAR